MRIRNQSVKAAIQLAKATEDQRHHLLQRKEQASTRQRLREVVSLSSKHAIGLEEMQLQRKELESRESRLTHRISDSVADFDVCACRRRKAEASGLAFQSRLWKAFQRILQKATPQYSRMDISNATVPTLEWRYGLGTTLVFREKSVTS